LRPPEPNIWDKYKAGSTRDIDAAFHPEGGIFFALSALFHVAVQRNSLLFFFAAPCRKNAGRARLGEIGRNQGSGICII
jgi:hypothetical protein